jgi:hypothetical protein
LSIYQPFTYLIGWSKLDRWYYGVRHKYGTSPSDLWSKYFTSSKIVRKFREEHGEPDVIQVRKTFSNKKAARDYELKVLRRMKVTKDDRWLNKACGYAIDCTGRVLSPETKSVLSEKSKGNQNAKGAVRSPEMKARLAEHNRGKKASLETRQKMSVSKQGHKPPSTKGMGWWNDGVVSKKFWEHPGDGWVKGRLVKWSVGGNAAGKYWWNDGQLEVQSTNCPGDGWSKGRISRKRSRRKTSP